jgi:aminoglycoside phosphotransferase (APT) family kinase protein
MGENERVTGSPVGPVLPAGEVRAAEALLTRAWGGPAVVRAAEQIWGRSHVVRLRLDTGRTVVLKRRRGRPRGRGAQVFGVELATLEYLNAMPVPVAPRLLGADTDAGLLLLEDLGEGTSLADSLLAGGRSRVQADLIAYAQALGSLHSWSMGRAGELADLRVRHAPGEPAVTRWPDAIRRGTEPFLSVAATLGLAAGGVADEIGQLRVMLSEANYLGLVHGDACPDNVHIAGGAGRIFDFETSGWGPVAFDAAYLLAPFPSCWCFASLPADIAGPAVAAYRARLEAGGTGLGQDWEDLTTAALAGLLIAHGPMLAEALDHDHEWGTTTMRPRFLAWLQSFTGRAGGGALPRLQGTASAMREQLAQRWPGLRVPDYPALAQAGSALARVPDGWRPARPPAKP